MIAVTFNNCCLFIVSLCVSTESHQVLAQLLDTLLVIGTQLPESPAVRLRLIEVACKVTHTVKGLYLSLSFMSSRGFSAQNNKLLPSF